MASAFCQLDWQVSTQALFSYFADKPWSMLLDSANAEHPDAKFDIICSEPIATLCYKDGTNRLTLCQENNIETTTDNPFKVISSLLKRFFPNPSSCPLPFSGGIVGALSYDLGREVEYIAEVTKDDLTLPSVNLGVYLWALIFDYKKQCWFLVHNNGHKALLEKQQQLEQMLTKPTPSAKKFSLSTQWHSQIQQEEYNQKFNKIQSYLKAGDCYQINLTQRFSAHYSGDEWQAYLRLSHANKAPFSAFIRLPEHSILSISPERFIKLENQHIQTKPIKGTEARSKDPTADKRLAEKLARSEKDRAENLMIVDLLRNDIGKVAQVGTVDVPELFAIESFPAVHHLVSTITAKLDTSLTAVDLLNAAFPGGSITGAPKVRAMEIIEELEPSRRSIYCGSIGYISQDGKMDTSITIRTLLAQEQQLYCWAGGGIVADSKAADEYQETFDKLSKILPVLDVNQELTE